MYRKLNSTKLAYAKILEMLLRKSRCYYYDDDDENVVAVGWVALVGVERARVFIFD